MSLVMTLNIKPGSFLRTIYLNINMGFSVIKMVKEVHNKP